MRGEFGPAWDGPGISKLTQGGDVVMGDTEKSTDAPADAMQVDEPKTKEAMKQVGEKQSRKDGTSTLHETVWEIHSEMIRFL